MTKSFIAILLLVCLLALGLLNSINPRPDLKHHQTICKSVKENV